MSNLTKHIKEANYQKLKLLSGRSIGIKGWKMEEEKEFLFSIESNTDDKQLVIEECIKLARSCVDNKELFDTLSKNDILYIISQMRKISKGGKIEFQFRCRNPECPSYRKYDERMKAETGMDGIGMEPFDAEVNVDEDIKTEPAKRNETEIGKYVFTFREIPFLERQVEIEKKYLSGEKPNLNAFQYYYILNSIESVKVGEEIFENPDVEELEELLDSFTPNEYKQLIDGYDKNRSHFTLEKKVKCPRCEKEMDVVYEELFSLLVF